MAGEGDSGRDSLRQRGIHDRHLLAAIRTVPADMFELSRQGQRLPNTASQAPVPFTSLVALMVQALELQGDERVLDVGTGSGYQAALLGRLAQEVYSVELEAEVSEAARRTLSKLGLRNVHVATGDGSAPPIGHARRPRRRPGALPHRAVR